MPRYQATLPAKDNDRSCRRPNVWNNAIPRNTGPIFISEAPIYPPPPPPPTHTHTHTHPTHPPNTHSLPPLPTPPPPHTHTHTHTHTTHTHYHPPPPPPPTHSPTQTPTPYPEHTPTHLPPTNTRFPILRFYLFIWIIAITILLRWTMSLGPAKSIVSREKIQVVARSFIPIITYNSIVTVTPTRRLYMISLA